MTAMTNPTVPDHGAALDPELLALAFVGGQRCPAKVVEHPAFRATRARLSAEAQFTVARLPVVWLNAPGAASANACAGSVCNLEAA